MHRERKDGKKILVVRGRKKSFLSPIEISPYHFLIDRDRLRADDVRVTGIRSVTSCTLLKLKTLCFRPSPSDWCSYYFVSLLTLRLCYLPQHNLVTINTGCLQERRTAVSGFGLPISNHIISMLSPLIVSKTPDKIQEVRMAQFETVYLRIVIKANS